MERRKEEEDQLMLEILQVLDNEEFEDKRNENRIYNEFKSEKDEDEEKKIYIEERIGADNDRDKKKREIQSWDESSEDDNEEDSEENENIATDDQNNNIIDTLNQDMDKVKLILGVKESRERLINNMITDFSLGWMYEIVDQFFLNDLKKIRCNEGDKQTNLSYQDKRRERIYNCMITDEAQLNSKEELIIVRGQTNVIGFCENILKKYLKGFEIIVEMFDIIVEEGYSNYVNVRSYYEMHSILKITEKQEREEGIKKAEIIGVELEKESKTILETFFLKLKGYIERFRAKLCDVFKYYNRLAKRIIFSWILRI